MKIMKIQYLPAQLGQFDKDELSEFRTAMLRVRLKRTSAGEFHFDALTGDHSRWRRLTKAEVALFRDVLPPPFGYWLDSAEKKIAELRPVD